MKPQKITILDRWLTAMRTPGLYQQARNMYCDEYGFCGLGVLANEVGMLGDDVRAAYSRYLSRNATGRLSGVDMDAVGQLSDGLVQLLIDAMTEQGLGRKHASVLYNLVPYWNDFIGMSLSEIAAYVEALVEAWKADPATEPGVVYRGMRFDKVKEAAHV